MLRHVMACGASEIGKLGGWLAAVAAALAAFAPQEPAVEVVLPLGAPAEAWRTVAAERAPGGPLAVEPWPSWEMPNDGERDAWSAGPPWRRWVELVRAEAAGPTDPARRAALTLLARTQERSEDAWAHWSSLASSPALAAALLPVLLPGVPPGSDLAALEPGVLLAPSLPPPRPADTATPIGPWAMEIGPLGIGEARVRVRVALEADGVEVDVVHLAGPTVSVRVLPPLPANAELTTVYVDWVRREKAAGAHEILVTPEDPEHALWARFRPELPTWPEPSPADGGTFPGRAGFAFVLDPDLGPATERCLGFGEALAELFEVPCAFLEPEDGPPATAAGAPPAGEPLVLRFDGPRAGEKLRALIGLAERHALARAR